MFFFRVVQDENGDDLMCFAVVDNSALGAHGARATPSGVGG